MPLAPRLNANPWRSACSCRISRTSAKLWAPCLALASTPFALRRLAGAYVMHAAMIPVRKGPKPDDNLV
jgi:hypothetical protein